MRPITSRTTCWLPIRVGLLSIALTATGRPQQAVPVQTLYRPDAAYGTAFTSVVGVRELRDGRVIVLDGGDGVVMLLDPRLSAATQIGRNGNGPGEYAAPQWLFALTGDSSGIRDWSNSRFLVITPDGKPGGYIDDHAGRDCATPLMRPVPAFLAADGRGMFYSQAEPITVAANGTRRPSDSAAVQRWRSPCAADTVAYVPNPYGLGSQLMGSGIVTPGPGYVRSPFPAETRWAVSRDGRVAIIRPDAYRVDFVDANGRRRDGASIPYTRVSVSNEVKQQWREEEERPMRAMVVGRDGNSRSTLQRRPIRT